MHRRLSTWAQSSSYETQTYLHPAGSLTTTSAVQAAQARGKHIASRVCRILQTADRPDDVCWLPGARLNIAQCCLQSRGNDDAIAMVWATEVQPQELHHVSMAELRSKATAVACGLRAMGLAARQASSLSLVYPEVRSTRLQI